MPLVIHGDILCHLRLNFTTNIMTVLVTKEAIRIIDDNHYIAHTKPICKKTTSYITV